MKIIFFSLLIFAGSFFYSHARDIKPGFDKEEYAEMLRINAQTNKSKRVPHTFYPLQYKHVYTSPKMGLDNVWQLWISDDSVAVISIRGTVDSSMTSWLANLYAAMVPAKGEIQLSDDYNFSYALAEHSHAAVHVGWLLATGFLSRDILPKIDSCYRHGIRNYYITGHSQGGGISFLMTSHLRSLQAKGTIPTDVIFKTYCSAGPKPGNLFYAYEYEVQTQHGWAYNVVNMNDYVPMLPFSIQTTEDILANGPFDSMKSLIREQEIPHKILLSLIYKKMEGPSLRAMEAYRKYLGEKVSEIIKKHIEDCNITEYFPSNYYVRTGAQHILKGNEHYYEQFSLASENLIEHHSPAAYYYILTETD